CGSISSISSGGILNWSAGSETSGWKKPLNGVVLSISVLNHPDVSASHHFPGLEGSSESSPPLKPCSWKARREFQGPKRASIPTTAISGGEILEVSETSPAVGTH